MGHLRRGPAVHRHDRALARLPGRRLHAREPEPGIWNRQVIAEPLQWGHAVWCVDLDADKDDELIIGQRDPNRAATAALAAPASSSSTSSPAPRPPAFARHTIDDGGMACEDALAADLDGDGKPDIIAGGRATHNVKIYWNRGH